MDKRAEHLRTLGLSADARWEEITDAYKDLMKVWHPDRFQGDERLLAKAQAKSQEINHAMAELRKLGKNPPKPPPQSSKSRPASTPSYDNNRDSFQQGATQAQNHSSQFRFMLSPLKIRMSFRSGLFRLLGGLVASFFCYMVLSEHTLPPLQQAGVLAVGFLALDFSIKHLILTLIPRALITVDADGIRLFDRGRFNWIDIEIVYPVVTHRMQTLNINCSQHYLQKCSPPIRFKYKLYRLIGRPHIQISFAGLRGTPVHVLDAMHLFQSNNQIELHDYPQSTSSLSVILSVLSYSAVAVALTHCFLQKGLSPREYLCYLAIFLVARGALILQMLLAR